MDYKRSHAFVKRLLNTHGMDMMVTRGSVPKQSVTFRGIVLSGGRLGYERFERERTVSGAISIYGLPWDGFKGLAIFEEVTVNNKRYKIEAFEVLQPTKVPILFEIKARL